MHWIKHCIYTIIFPPPYIFLPTSCLYPHYTTLQQHPTVCGSQDTRSGFPSLWIGTHSNLPRIHSSPCSVLHTIIHLSWLILNATLTFRGEFINTFYMWPSHLVYILGIALIVLHCDCSRTHILLKGEWAYLCLIYVCTPNSKGRVKQSRYYQ